MQETQVQSLTRQDTMCSRATKPMQHIYWATAPEPESRNSWGLHTPEPMQSNKRGHGNEESARQIESPPPPPLQLEKSPCSNEDPTQPQINKNFKCIKKRNA